MGCGALFWSCLCVGGLWLGGFVFSPVFWAVCPPPVHPDGALPPRRRRAWSGRPLPGDATGVRTARRLPAVVVVIFFWPALAGMSCVCGLLRAGVSSPARVATYRSLPSSLVCGRVLGRVQHTFGGCSALRSGSWVVPGVCRWVDVAPRGVSRTPWAWSPWLSLAWDRPVLAAVVFSFSCRPVWTGRLGSPCSCSGSIAGIALGVRRPLGPTDRRWVSREVSVTAPLFVPSLGTSTLGAHFFCHHHPLCPAWRSAGCVCAHPSGPSRRTLVRVSDATDSRARGVGRGS